MLRHPDDTGNPQIRQTTSWDAGVVDVPPDAQRRDYHARVEPYRAL